MAATMETARPMVEPMAMGRSFRSEALPSGRSPACSIRRPPRNHEPFTGRYVQLSSQPRRSQMMRCSLILLAMCNQSMAFMMAKPQLAFWLKHSADRKGRPHKSRC